MTGSTRAAQPSNDAATPQSGPISAGASARTEALLYWAALALIASTVLIPRLLPCVDYPQHLALADIARRLQDPAAPEQLTHSLNVWTYNGLFHLITAALARWMPIEAAGRTVVAGSLLLLGGATRALLSAIGRPSFLAALFLPVVFSFSVGWGFVNYALGTALAVSTLALVAHACLRPRWTLAIATALVGQACAMTHVLATLLLCLLAAALTPELAWRATAGQARGVRRFARFIGRAFVALAPLLVACGYCVQVYREQYKWNPDMYRDPTLEGSAPPLWQKVAYFGAFANGQHSDHSDQVLLWAGLAMVAVASIAALVTFARSSRGGATATNPNGRSDGTALLLPLFAALAAYLATPMVAVGTHLIFPRLAQAVVLGVVLAAPVPEGRWRARMRTAALTLGVVTGLNAAAHAVWFARETDDASKVIDDMPPGRRATAVVYGADTNSYRSGALVHLAAYYGARKHGDWAFSFARYLSVPVRFKAGGGPPWPKIGWEFNAADYNPRCKFAHTFDLVIVRAPRDLPTDASAEPAVRRVVFKEDAAAVRLISHHGGFWAFDARGLPEDGTF